jgi:hypothetical protein
MLALKLKGIGGCRNPEGQKELDHLKVVYPEGSSESAWAKAIELKLSKLRQGKAASVSSAGDANVS